MSMGIGSSQSGIELSSQGYRKAEASMAVRAKNIATATAQGASDQPPPPNAPDLATNLVGMKTDSLSGSYNLKALKVQNNMSRELIDLIA